MILLWISLYICDILRIFVEIIEFIIAIYLKDIGDHFGDILGTLQIIFWWYLEVICEYNSKSFWTRLVVIFVIFGEDYWSYTSNILRRLEILFVILRQIYWRYYWWNIEKNWDHICENLEILGDWIIVILDRYIELTWYTLRIFFT